MPRGGSSGRAFTSDHGAALKRHSRLLAKPERFVCCEALPSPCLQPLSAARPAPGLRPPYNRQRFRPWTGRSRERETRSSLTSPMYVVFKSCHRAKKPLRLKAAAGVSCRHKPLIWLDRHTPCRARCFSAGDDPNSEPAVALLRTFCSPDDTPTCRSGRPSVHRARARRLGRPSADYSWRRGFFGGERGLKRPAHV